MTKTMSKTFSTTMDVVMVTITSEPRIMGTMMLEELLTLAGAVEAGGLGDLGGHALDGCGEHDHGEAGLQPDEDDDEREGGHMRQSAVCVHGIGSRPMPSRMALSNPYCGWPGGRQV